MLASNLYMHMHIFTHEPMHTHTYTHASMHITHTQAFPRKLLHAESLFPGLSPHTTETAHLHLLFSPSALFPSTTLFLRVSLPSLWPSYTLTGIPPHFRSF